jgi:hypothetical protein
MFRELSVASSLDASGDRRANPDGVPVTARCKIMKPTIIDIELKKYMEVKSGRLIYVHLTEPCVNVSYTVFSTLGSLVEKIRIPLLHHLQSKPSKIPSEP